MSSSGVTSIEGSEGQPVELDVHLPAGSGPHAVVLICHGFKGFKDWGFFADLCDRLAARGLAAVRFNFSHNGVGLGDDRLDFTRLDMFERDRLSYRIADVHAVYGALSRGELQGADAIDHSRAGIFGHSLGGAAALIAQHELPFRALATLASVDRVTFSPEQIEVLERDGRLLIPNARTKQMMPLGLAALQDVRAHADRFDLDAIVRDLDVPWLIVHGDADPSVSVDAARRLFALAPEGRAELDLVDGADHVMDVGHPFAGPSPAYEHFAERTAAFFCRHLGVGEPA